MARRLMVTLMLLLVAFDAYAATELWEMLR